MFARAIERTTFAALATVALMAACDERQDPSRGPNPSVRNSGDDRPTRVEAPPAAGQAPVRTDASGSGPGTTATQGEPPQTETGAPAPEPRQIR